MDRKNIKCNIACYIVLFTERFGNSGKGIVSNEQERHGKKC